MITAVFLNLIYVFFPLVCYFIYSIYSKVIYEEEKKIFFVLALFSSIYLCIKFGDIKSFSLIAVNIPFFLSLYKKNLTPSVLLSFLISIEFCKFYNVSIILPFLQYFLIIILRYLFNLNSVNIFMPINFLFTILITLSSSINNLNINEYIYILFSWILVYILTVFIISMYKKLENIINMYHSLQDIMKEKALYQSLFKITHEIKNPLAVCKGYLEMFDIRNPSKANKYVSIISQEIDRTLVLLKDFSDVSKINIEKNVMDINMLLEDVCDESRLIFKNNMKFNFNLCEGEINVYADYNRLKQVLINVIKNAKEAIGEEGEVILTSKCKNNEYIITVKDNGCGMSKEIKNKIGTPFYTTKKNGTGLGVFLSKEIIELHGGSMRYYSKTGKGTEVKIILPYKNTPIN